jgi:hypothetical protein
MPMTEPDDRRVLQAYRAASAALDEAPAEDTRAAILAAAARATAARPQPLGRPRRRLPWAAAASVLVGAIAVLLATQVEREAPAGRTATIAAAPAAPVAPEAKVPADADVREGAGPASPPADRAAPAAAVRSKAPDRPQTDRESAPTTTAAPAAAPPAPAAAEPTAPPAPPPPDVAGRDAAVRGATQLAAAKVEQAGDGARQPAPSAPPPDVLAKPEDELQRAQLGAAPAGRPSARAAGEARADGALAASPWRATPEAWIERIVRLRGEGRHREADTELAALRERHPDLRVPQAALPAADR